MILDENNIGTQYLVINGFDMQTDNMDKRASVLEMIDRTRTPLLGIIPMDARLSLLNENGENIFDTKKCNSRTAFINIAKRLTGESTPLLKGFVGVKKNKLLYR